MLIYLKKTEKLRGNQLLHICTMIALLAISKQILSILQNLFLYLEIMSSIALSTLYLNLKPVEINLSICLEIFFDLL